MPLVIVTTPPAPMEQAPAAVSPTVRPEPDVAPGVKVEPNSALPGAVSAIDCVAFAACTVWATFVAAL